MAEVLDLLAVYYALPLPPGTGDIYLARAIGGHPDCRIAKDAGGHPALLVSVASEGSIADATALELRNLVFRPQCSCRVRAEDAGESSETLAVLTCTANDELLRDYFLRVLSGAIAALPSSPTQDDVAALVHRLVELFRALESPPRSSLQGLWCELLLIRDAPRVRQAAAAWHARPTALHDFAAGPQRVEVKSCSGPHRRHRFRLEQLLPMSGTELVIASFLLEETGGGSSIAELWEQVSRDAQLTLGLRQRLEHVLAMSLGRDWQKAGRVSYDPDQALRSLRLFDPARVPMVTQDLPVEVSDVEFTSELSNTPSLARPDVARAGGLFEAMFG